MNIRSNVPNDHVQSISEIAHSQSQMIQLLTIEINEKDKEIERLNNIIDKAIERLTLNGDIQEKDVIEVFANAIRDARNILNGGDN